jgi:hypothetical protein
MLAYGNKNYQSLSNDIVSLSTEMTIIAWWFESIKYIDEKRSLQKRAILETCDIFEVFLEQRIYLLS